MEAAMSGNDVYNTLTPETLGYIDGVVEPTEGFANGQLYFLESGGLTIAQNGSVTSAPLKGFPDIGYGSYLKDVNSLAAVLQVFTMTSQVTINGVQQSFTGNVFQISADIAVASGQPVTPATSIVEYFQELVTGDTSEYQLTVSSQDEVLAKLNSDISNALGDFIAGTTYREGIASITFVAVPDGADVNEKYVVFS
jgi:hypothetical protein